MSDLLPPNASPQERALSLATGRDVPTPVRSVWNPDTCPAELLAWLAWAFSVDEWDGTWTEAQKRSYIKRSIEVQKFKGTIGSVKAALSALFYEAQIQEWFNQVPPGDPYTFKVLLSADQVGIGEAAIESLFSVVDRVKNLRSHLGPIELSAKTTTGPTLATCAGLGSEISVSYHATPLVLSETTICM